jgi:hypothetical protein
LKEIVAAKSRVLEFLNTFKSKIKPEYGVILIAVAAF